MPEVDDGRVQERTYNPATFLLEGGVPAVGKSATSPDVERKQITALFSELSGYTAMTGQLDPEDVREITGKIFQKIKEVVVRYDGFTE